MSTIMEKMLRGMANLLFNKPPTFSTKDIFKHIDKEEYKKKLDKVTQFVLKEMYCENTGSHFLDSGGVGGRGYDRANAVKDLDWMEQKSTVVNVEQYSRDGSYNFYVLKNAYLFLCEHLEYDLQMDQNFHKFCNSDRVFEFRYFDNHKVPVIALKGANPYKDYVNITKKRVEYYTPKDETYYSNMTAWKKLLSDWEFDYQDLKGYNTANGETCLNKTLQWDMFYIDNGKYEGAYIILQIHNGCDIRGGYSTPHIFKFDEDDFWCDLNDLSARCPNHGKKEDVVAGVQKDLEGNDTKDPALDLEHVDCYSDDTGNHWYANCGDDIDGGAEFKTDEEGEHHLVCKKCGAEIEFW